jgi:hypothetical protein
VRSDVIDRLKLRQIVEEIPTDFHFTKFERGSEAVAHISAFSCGEFGAVLRHSNEPKKLLTAIKVNGRVFRESGRIECPKISPPIDTSSTYVVHQVGNSLFDHSPSPPPPELKK